MKREALSALALWTLCVVPAVAQKAQPESTIVVSLTSDKAHAVDRVTMVMTNAGLQLEQAEFGLVVGTGTGPKHTTIGYTAVVLEAGEGSRVVLSAQAFGNTLHLGPTEIKQQARVTSTMGHGAEKVWAQLQSLADSLRVQSP
jgi:hypothetical protein